MHWIAKLNSQSEWSFSPTGSATDSTCPTSVTGAGWQTAQCVTTLRSQCISNENKERIRSIQKGVFDSKQSGRTFKKDFVPIDNNYLLPLVQKYVTPSNMFAKIMPLLSCFDLLSGYESESESESESDVTYGQVWWPILGIRALHLTHPKCTHTAVNTHTPGAVGSHLCCGARGAVGGSVPCSRAPQSWYWRWREHCSFTPPHLQFLPAWDSNSQPLDYESETLTIRPQLPQMNEEQKTSPYQSLYIAFSRFTFHQYIVTLSTYSTALWRPRLSLLDNFHGQNTQDQGFCGGLKDSPIQIS